MSNTDEVRIDIQQVSNPKVSLTDDQKKSFTKNVANYFKEYCDVTGIHGFRYFGEPRTIFEKIWWFFIFTICLILCTLTILLIYKKWDENPLIVSFTANNKHITQIPFPAITVCAESKVRYDMFDYDSAFIRKRNRQNLTEKEENFLDVLSYVCNYHEDVHSSNVNSKESEEFLDVLSTVSPKFSIINCKYLYLSESLCDILFSPIVTDEGLCYTFNILDREDIFNENVIHYKNFHQMASAEEWSIDHGYKDTVDAITYPQRALMVGATYGLTFELKVENEKLDTLCRGTGGGYRFLLHAPIHIPRLSLEYLRVAYNQSISVTVRPSDMTTSKTVKDYPVQKRQCYFSYERKLTFFKIYSLKNCHMECLANLTLFICNCVSFYMPALNGTRICTGSDYMCTTGAERIKMRIQMAIPSEAGEEQDNPESYTYNCDCLPTCSNIVYSPSSTQSYWDWSTETENHHHELSDTNDNTNYYLAKVTVYFTSDTYIGSEKNELYGPIDFIANFGGLLGLFTGFSILSLVEIIYFLSVRLICNVRLYGNWAG